MSHLTVVVTRPADQSASFVRALSDLGANSVQIPGIEIQGQKIASDSRQILEDFQTGRFSWLVFSSVNGIKYFVDFLCQANINEQIPPNMKVAAVGEETAKSFQQKFHRSVDLVPTDFVAEALAEKFSRIDIKGQRILLAGARKTRGILPEALRAQGALPTELAVYETLPVSTQSSELSTLYTKDPAELVFTFFSPSAFKSIEKMLQGKLEILRSSTIVSVVPVTSRAIQAGGYKVKFEAQEHSEKGVLGVLSQMLKEDSPSV